MCSVEHADIIFIGGVMGVSFDIGCFLLNAALSLREFILIMHGASIFSLFFKKYCKPPDEYPGKTNYCLRKIHIQTFLISQIKTI